MIDSAWLGTTRSSSNTSFSPRPSQAGQAPCGALKENRRGSISAMVKPLTGQANFSEKMMRPGARVVELHAGRRLPRRSARRIGGVEVGEALGELERGLEAVGEARLDAFADDDAVDHHLDVVLVLLVERRRFLDGVELAVDADAGEARLLPLGELLAVLALAAADDGREQVMAAALGQAP